MSLWVMAPAAKSADPSAVLVTYWCEERIASAELYPELPLYTLMYTYAHIQEHMYTE